MLKDIQILAAAELSGAVHFWNPYDISTEVKELEDHDISTSFSFRRTYGGWKSNEIFCHVSALQTFDYANDRYPFSVTKEGFQLLLGIVQGAYQEDQQATKKMLDSLYLHGHIREMIEQPEKQPK